MPWVVGIDEAGYGPNLGPLLQAAVALELPESDLAGWQTFSSTVRRQGERGSKLLIDDSKKVHTGKNGLEKLRDGVMRWFGLSTTTLGSWLTETGLADIASEAATEYWFDPEEQFACPLPPLDFPEGVTRGPVRVNMVQPTRFNRVVGASNSKATVLSEGLIALLGSITTSLPAGSEIRIDCDKQGGRNFYGPLLQEAFPTGWVHADFEKAEESRYRIENLPGKVIVSFRPRADGASIAVAVASMVCKWLREICMGQFNRYWQKHVVGLAPTAGYPVDARRFFAEIEAKLPELGLLKSQVWRER